MKRLLSGLIIISFLSACAVTMPASETIMFESKNRESPEKEEMEVFSESYVESDNNRHINPYAKSSVFKYLDFPFRKGYQSFSVRPKLREELDYAKEKFAAFVQEKKQEPDIDDERFEIASPLNLAVALPIPLKRSSSFALSGNVGFPVLGVDMTVQTFKNTFITANLSYLSGEVIAQQRLFNRKDIGIAIGPHYRLQRRWLRVIEGPDETFGISTIMSLIIPARTYYNHTVGIRTVIYLPVSENTFLHVVAAPGYVTNLGEFTFNMGLSLKYQLW